MKKPTYQELEKELEILRKKDFIQIGVLDSFVDPIYVTSSDYKIEYLNFQMIQLLGENKIGTKCYKTMYGLDTICEWCIMDKLKRDEIISYELQHHVTNRIYIVKNLLLKTGSKVSTYYDITDHRETEKELINQNDKLKASELRYKVIFNDSYSVKLLIDPENGKIIDANRAASDFYGYSIEQITQMNIKEINIMPDAEIQEEILRVKNAKQNKFLFKHKLANNDIKDVEVHAGEISFASKSYLLSIIYDVSERLAAEKALHTSEQELRESNATKDKFFSIISHDLKSPFSYMLGFSDLLVDNFDNYEVAKQKNIISYIHKGIRNTYKLLENLLTWSRAQSGTIIFKQENISLFLFANETIEILNQSATNKSIEIINQIPEIFNITSDKNILSTIFRNLISNSIKFTEKRGKIIINAIITNRDIDDKFVEISVKDSGVGISEEIQLNLFDINKNVSTRGTKNEAGTGIGLIICQEFIEKQGGKIWVESEIGKGSTFYFTIPYKS